MDGRRVPIDVVQRTIDTMAIAGSQVKTSELLGIARSTVQTHLKLAIEMGLEPRHSKPDETQFPILPDDQAPVEETIEALKQAYDRKVARKRAAHWMPITLGTDLPIGIAWVGDPHVDSPGCNWRLLDRDVAIIRKTEGLFGANIGDSSDNWVGRLMREYAKSDVSRETARKLIRWLMFESGIEWLIWLLGNHDEWNFGTEMLKEMGGNPVWMHEWQARFTLNFSNGAVCKIWAAHDFPGHSQWNSLHGPQKAAHMKDMAHFYICGHKHNWALHQEESASREFVYWLGRARGYKFIDEYSERLGHSSQQEGAAITMVVNPRATTMSGFMQCFADLEVGADYLTFLRSKYAA